MKLPRDKAYISDILEASKRVSAEVKEKYSEIPFIPLLKTIQKDIEVL
jgi:uncharacterized protein with HEPN domain